MSARTTIGYAARLALAAGLALVAPFAPAQDAAVLADANGVVDASRSAIPPSNADLEAIARDARQIMALAGACNEAKCPTVETCAAAARLLQALTDAQAYLDATEAALNKAAAAAAASHNNVVAQTRITSTNLGIALQALGVQEYLARLATLLMDIASLGDDIKGMVEKGTILPGDNGLQKLDTLYETLKDAQSLLNDSLDAANEQANAITGGDESAPKLEPLKTEYDDAKSNLSDAVNAVRDARQEFKENGGKMTPGAYNNLGKAAGKIAFRFLKAKVDAQIEALKKYIAELEASLSAEQRILAGLFRERMRMVARRDAATDARRAVSAARSALMACMARTCGMPSLTRPTIPDFYAPPAGMSARDLPANHGWGAALKALAPRLAAVAAQLAERFEVKDICPGGGGGSVTDPGGGDDDTGAGGAGGFPTRNKVETRCLPCRPIAEAIARAMDEMDFRRAEIARINRNLEEARKVRVQLEGKERLLAVHDRYLAELREIVRNAKVLGISVAGQTEQNLTLAEAKRVQMVAEINALRRDIERLESEKRLLPVHTAALAALEERRDALRKRLQRCEEDQCRAGYYGELDTWINIAGNNPLDPNGPLGGGGVDARPAVSVEMVRPTGEGDAPGVFAITLSMPAPPGGVFVTYSFEGSATPSADFFAVFVGAPIPAGAQRVEVTVTPVDDTLVEGSEEVLMTLRPGDGYRLGVPSRASMPFSDNDAPPQAGGLLQFGASSYSGAEGGLAVTVTVTRSSGSDGPVGVSYSTSGGSATPGADFQAVSGALAWAAGDVGAKTFQVPIVEDSAVEGNESFTLRLSQPTGGATLGPLSTATVTIADNDVATGPCGAQGSAWVGNAGNYSCSGSCDPTPSPQALAVNGDVVTINPFHALGAATFRGCGTTLDSESTTLRYFGQSNHRARITRNSNNSYSALIQSSGGGSCSMSCSR